LDRDNKRRSKETADSKWLRATNFGYFETVEVFHWSPCIEYLVWKGYLHELDAECTPRINEAVDALFQDEVDKWLASNAEREEDGLPPANWVRYSNHNFRGKSYDGLGSVRVRVHMDLVDMLGLGHRCDDKREILLRLEEALHSLYSNLADRDLYDPWPTTGRVMTRPLWSPLERNRKEYLKGIGIIGDKSTAFRQDNFITPEGDNIPPGSTWDGDGLMEGKRQRPKTERGGDDFGPEDWEV
jgi:hypothetical protein